MEAPPRFNDWFKANKVYKLQKALHGLKQFPRAWFERFAKAMENWKFL